MASTFYRPVDEVSDIYYWQTSTGATFWYGHVVNESTPNDTDYMLCNQGGNRNGILNMTGTAPGFTVGGARLRVRCRYDVGTSGTHFLGIYLDNVLLEEAAPPSVWTTKVFEIDQATAAAFGSSPQVKLQSKASASTRVLQVSWVELEIYELVADTSGLVPFITSFFL